MALHKKEEALCLELGNKDSLQRSYGNQAVILKAWGQLEDAMALHKKEEALCLELGNKDGLQRSYGNQAGILMAWGRLEEAMALHKKLEALCLELGSKYGLQASYGNQALILRSWGRLEEAMALHKKQEALCLELGVRRDLGYCYWQWGPLARAQGDRVTERAKLQTALDIFTALKMPRERDAVAAELAKTAGTRPLPSKHRLLPHRLARGNELIFDQLDFVVLGYLRKKDALRPRSIPTLAAQLREFPMSIKKQCDRASGWVEAAGIQQAVRFRRVVVKRLGP
jgi:tetratricopeptide (TPR) repeat protein